VQSQTAALERLQGQARERIEKLNGMVAQLKADVEQQRTELAATQQKLQETEERADLMEGQLDREQRERQKLSDKSQILDDEVETAQARAEQLNDEATKLRGALKKAQEDLLLARKQLAQFDERLRNDELLHNKKVEEAKSSVLDLQTKAKDEIDGLRRERDEARQRAQDIKTKAEGIVRKYKELEAQLGEARGSGDKRVEALNLEVRTEKETRARERAQAKAQEEKLLARLAELERGASDQAEGQIVEMRAQLRERDERLAKVTLESQQMRDKAKEAITRLRAADEKLKLQAAGQSEAGVSKEHVQQLKDKLNEAVKRLKDQAGLNKALEERFKELSQKHQRALAMLQEYREAGASEATMVMQVPKVPD
jgi:chromosome segregation ATPase